MHLPLSENMTSNGAASVRTETARALPERIATKQAVIGVIGLGYVGLPLAMAYAGRGFRTFGVDLAVEKVLRLNEGDSYIQDVESETLRQALDAGRFVAQDDYAAMGDADIVFICVPTPVTVHKDPDTSYIEAAARSVARHLREGQMIVLKSTTYPNTTEGLVLPILEEAAGARGLQLGRDYFLAFSPERVDPGNQVYTTENTPVVVGGVTKACTKMAALALEQIVAHVHQVSRPGVAEMEKLLENIFRSVNIALVNELAKLCDRMGGISIWEVVEAAATKPFGFMPFNPGPGVGGHCIPIDPYYLSWLARKYDFETSFITLAARVNEDMPFYVGNAVLRAIADQPVRARDAKVLLLGVAFKKNVDDTRHSPALKVLEVLRSQGVNNINYCDPYVPKLTVHLPQETLGLTSVSLSEEVLKDHDVVVILTEHDDFPYGWIVEHASAVVDTRNALRDVPHDHRKVQLLGGG